MSNKILLIEDDETYVEGFRLMMREHAVEIVWAPDAKTGIQKFKESPYGYATVVVDYGLPNEIKGSWVCQELRRINQKQDILFATGFRDLETYTDIMLAGMSGFLPKGQPSEETRDRVLKSIDLYNRANRIIGADTYTPSQAEAELNLAGMMGRSELLYRVLKDIEKYRVSPYSTIIVGETGAGKELVAKALVPPGKKLITLNCGEFREGLLESELFGHMKGACE